MTHFLTKRDITIDRSTSSHMLSLHGAKCDFATIEQFNAPLTLLSVANTIIDCKKWNAICIKSSKILGNALCRDLKIFKKQGSFGKKK